jgi:hypothetical protein
MTMFYTLLISYTRGYPAERLVIAKSASEAIAKAFEDSNTLSATIIEKTEF